MCVGKCVITTPLIVYCDRRVMGYCRVHGRGEVVLQSVREGDEWREVCEERVS